MIFSDQDIKEALKSGRIKISPKPDLDVQLGSCSIDLRLDNTFRIFNHSKYAYIDLRENLGIDKIMTEVKVKDNEPFIMQPGDYVLASTIESIEIADDLLGRIEGRSSLGRIGIIVHGTASVFDPGWVGNATMELGNLGNMPVALYPGMRICSFTFEELKSPTTKPYTKKKGVKYAFQKGPDASRLDREIDTKRKK
jgi:dCTP deaminase